MSIQDSFDIIQKAADEIRAHYAKPMPPNIFEVARMRREREAKAAKVCRCNSYKFPHRVMGGKCEGVKACTCKPEVDPYNSGDSGYARVMDCTCGAND